MSKKNREENTNRAKKILEKLYNEFGHPKGPLKSETPLQLLIAVILSAQCTDERVNKVTPALFKKFKSAKDFGKAKITEIEKLIKSTGFYHNKAKNIKACCSMIVSKYNGKVPSEMEELILLPGVGRKTANVVLHQAFGKSHGFVVDTHVGRLAVRLGLTSQSNSKAAEKIELDLMNAFPKEKWDDASLLLIFHGRKTCTARKMYCERCCLNKLCPSAIK
jgi:endonuclease III